MDLSQLSDQDLDALSRNDMKSVSDEGLHVVATQTAPQSAPAPTTKTESAVRGLAQGATAGFGDEAAGLHSALTKGTIAESNPDALGHDFIGHTTMDAAGILQKLYQAATSDKSLAQTLDQAKQDYVSARDAERARNAEAKEANPWTYGASNVAGAAIPMIASGATSIPAMAAQGAVQGLGDSDADLTKGEFGQAAKDTAKGGVIGGVVGAAAPVVGKALGAGVDAATDVAGSVGKWATGKVGKVLANIPEEFTSAYVDAGGNIEARSEKEIADELVKLHGDSAENVANARDALDASKQSASDLTQNSRDTLADQKFQATQDLQNSRQDLNEAFQGKKQALADSSVMHLKEPILEDIDYLKQSVSNGSSKAFDILGKESGSVQTKPLLDLVQSGIDELTINGSPISDSANNSFKNLNALRDRLADAGDQLSFKDSKKILQQLDSDGIYSAEKGSFAPEADAVKAQLRHSLDQQLKQASPAYADQMAKVADQTQLLQQLSDGFGTQTKVINRLNNMATEKGRQVDFELLKKLGEVTKTDYETPISQYLKDKDLVTNPQAMDSMKQSLPEFQKYQNASKKYLDLMNPQTRRAVQQAPEIQSANQKVNQSQAMFDHAKEQDQVYGRLNPGQVQSKIRALNGARNYGADDLFSRVDELTGKDYTGEIKNRAILDSFQKGNTNGSRNVKMGSVIGGPAGAAGGYVADKFAGQAFKQALDTGIGISKFADKLGPYAKVLTDAAKRGPQAVAAAHYLLQQRDQKYRERINAINGGDDQ